jgi:hypothetical protein
VILRNLLYGCTVVPMGGWSGLGLVTLVVLWAMLRGERA